MIHPEHINDIIHAIRFLACTDLISFSGIYLIGHSAGALMSGHIMLNPSCLDSTTKSRVRGVVGVAGIYDIPEMIQVYPDYAEWFIEDAFGADQDLWKHVSPQHLSPEFRIDIPYLIIHSKDDELLTENQSIAFARHLKEDLKHSKVTLDTTTVIGKHHDFKLQPSFYTLVDEFISTSESTSKVEPSKPLMFVLDY